MVQVLDAKTIKILQFLDSKIEKKTNKFLDPKIVEKVGFLDQEILEMVDKSFILKT